MNKFITIFFSITIAFNVFSIKTSGQTDFLNNSVILQNLEIENLTFFDSLIRENGPNALIFDNSHTILTIAIVENKFNLVKYVLQNGADINLIVNNISPLMHCAISDRPDIASYLIRNGAKVDLYNTFRNTALLYASRYGNINTLKVLAQNRANPFFKNFQEYNSLDYAAEFFKTETVKYLKVYMAQFAKGFFPSTFDGPHVEITGIRRIRAFYMLNDSVAGKIYTVKKNYRLRNNAEISGMIAQDTLTYTIHKPINNSSVFNFTNVSNVFAIGDIHGSYDSLLRVLINNKVIDSRLNWTFGSGHLVFIGDLFDRGDKVTELLWLAYKLWNDAPKNGGMVHLILGNHELLILNKDYRYLNEKYSYLTRGLNIEFNSLFTNNTILGNFIRSFKVAIKIDSVLFVHAGISPYIAEKKISIPDLNISLYNVLNLNKHNQITDRTISVYTDIVSDKGPIWYRGYLTENKTIPRATQQELNDVLMFYESKLMVIGHTEILKIESLYEGKLIPLNVPFDRIGVTKQALRIKDGRFYRCNSDGTEQIIR